MAHIGTEKGFNGDSTPIVGKPKKKENGKRNGSCGYFVSLLDAVDRYC